MDMGPDQDQQQLTMQRAVALPLRREAFAGRGISSCRWGRSQQFYSVLLACGKVFCLGAAGRAACTSSGARYLLLSPQFVMDGPAAGRDGRVNVTLESLNIFGLRRLFVELQGAT